MSVPSNGPKSPTDEDVSQSDVTDVEASSEEETRQDNDAMPDQLGDNAATIAALGSLLIVYGLLFMTWYFIFNEHSVYYMLNEWIPILVVVSAVACLAPLQYVWGPSVAQKFIDKYL